MKYLILLSSSCSGVTVFKEIVTPNEEIEPLGPDTGDLSGFEDFNLASSRHIQNDLTYRWPNKLISVDLSPKVAPNVVGSMHQAFKELGLKAGIKFKPHSYDDDDYIRIFAGGGCASMLGRQGGRQHLTLASGCHSMATIMHEFTHALGIGHTQARVLMWHCLKCPFGNSESV